MARILILEDRPSDRMLLATLLRSEGYEVVEASHGEEALQALTRTPVDLVISDILMPTMDGYEFVRRLREIPGVGTSLVIFHSAVYHEREARALAARCGVVDILRKPSESKAVLATVEAVLAGGTAGRTTRFRPIRARPFAAPDHHIRRQIHRLRGFRAADGRNRRDRPST